MTQTEGWGEATALASYSESLSIMADLIYGRRHLRQSVSPVEEFDGIGRDCTRQQGKPKSVRSIAARACGCVELNGEVTLRLQRWKLTAGSEALPPGGYGPHMFDFNGTARVVPSAGVILPSRPKETEG